VSPCLTAATVQWQCPCWLNVGHPTGWQPKFWALGGRRWSCTGCKAPGYCMFPLCRQPRPCKSRQCMFPFFLFTGRGVYHLQNFILCFVDVSCSHVQARSLAVRQLAKKVASCVVDLACPGLQSSFGACASSNHTLHACQIDAFMCAMCVVVMAAGHGGSYRQCVLWSEVVCSQCSRERVHAATLATRLLLSGRL
jgi:hypothetical protein